MKGWIIDTSLLSSQQHKASEPVGVRSLPRDSERPSKGRTHARVGRTQVFASAEVMPARRRKQSPRRRSWARPRRGEADVGEERARGRPQQPGGRPRPPAPGAYTEQPAHLGLTAGASVQRTPERSACSAGWRRARSLAGAPGCWAGSVLRVGGVVDLAPRCKVDRRCVQVPGFFDAIDGRGCLA
jgi:hypothetical protein